MYCEKCGAQIDDDSVFCQKCGEKQLQEIETATAHSHPNKDVKKSSLSFFRKVFKTTASKIIAGVLAVAILATGVVIVVNNKDESTFVSDSISVLVEPTFEYYSVEPFSEGFAIVKTSNRKGNLIDDKYGVVDKRGIEVIPPQDDDIISFKEGFAIVKTSTGNSLDDRYGVVGENGKEIIPPVYNDISFFLDGFAVNKDGQYSYMDKTGKVIMPLDYFPLGYFNGDLRAARKDERNKGYIDETGKVVIPLEFNDIGDFNDGLACVEKYYDLGNGSSYTPKGYIDMTGKLVIPLRYEDAHDFSDGLATVRQGPYNYAFIDTDGNVVTVIREYSAVFAIKEGFARVRKNNKMDDSWGIIDKNGREIVPPKYDGVSDFSEGLAAVSRRDKLSQPDENNYIHIESYLKGFVDTTGKVVVPLKYNYVRDFKGGLAKVGNYDGGKNENGERTGKFGFIDKTGKEIVPLIYDEVEDFDNGLARVKKDGKYGFVDKTGKEVVPPVYDGIGTSVLFDIDYKMFKDGLVRVKKDGKYGFVDTTGKEVIPPVYDYAGEILEDRDGFNEGYVCVRKGKKYGYIDKTGKEVVPFIYDDAQNFSEGLAWVRQGKKWGILKINEPTSNNSSSTATSDASTINNSTETNTTAINIDDYVGMWHIDGQNYDSTYAAAYETELGIEKLSNNNFSFWLIREHKYEISCETTLNGNTADFTYENGQYIVIGTLTFNKNSITVSITSSDMPYNPVGTITFDSRHGGIYDNGRGEDETNDTSSGLTCPRCGRTLTDGETCDCTWCDICNAWMLGHGHGEGEDPVNSSTSQSSNDSTFTQNGTDSEANFVPIAPEVLSVTPRINADNNASILLDITISDLSLGEKSPSHYNAGENLTITVNGTKVNHETAWWGGKKWQIQIDNINLSDTKTFTVVLTNKYGLSTTRTVTFP